MIIRSVKSTINSKQFQLFIICSFILYILNYLCIKNEFFYNTIQYNLRYINYYVDRYLQGNINDLIFNNNILMYIESDVKNIFSSLYLYVATFNSNLFLIFSILMSIVIFDYILKKFYDDIHKNRVSTMILRIGKNKYINSTIISNIITSGLIFLIPKILYFLILSIFFPVGISYTHFIGTASFISEKFLYVGYNYNPYIMIMLDFIFTFLYGAALSLISMIVVTISKNKAMSYLVYIFLLGVLSIVPSAFSQSPFIFYSSIYKYFSAFYTSSFELNVYEPIIILSAFNLLLIFITKRVLEHKIRKII